MSQVIHGIIRGTTIELLSDPGLGDGQHVDVVVRPCLPATVSVSEKTVTTAAGMMSPFYSEQDDTILAEIQRERKTARRREVDE